MILIEIVLKPEGKHPFPSLTTTIIYQSAESRIKLLRTASKIIEIKIIIIIKIVKIKLEKGQAL